MEQCRILIITAIIMRTNGNKEKHANAINIAVLFVRITAKLFRKERVSVRKSNTECTYPILMTKSPTAKDTMITAGVT